MAALAQGSAFRLQSICNDPHYEGRREFLLTLLSKRGWNLADFADVLTKIEELYEKDEENSLGYHKDVELLFAQIFMWFRDLYLLKTKGDKERLYFPDKLSLLEERSSLALPSFDKLHELLEKAKVAIERNIKLKAVMEVLLIELGVF
jgi:hypothetical protein